MPATPVLEEDLTELVADMLINHDTSPESAAPVAQALVAAEIDGQKGHGFYE